MSYRISTYQNNEKHGDDCYKVIEFDNKKEVVAIVCDGVSSSASGRIASFLTTKLIHDFFTENLKFANKNPVDFFSKLIKKIKNEFSKFHGFLDKYKSIDSQWQSEIPEQVDESNIAELNNTFIQYASIFELFPENFSKLINKIQLTSAEFSTTLNILWLKKIDNIFWRAVCFNLGDGYLIQTNIGTGNEGLDFKDLFFYRSVDIPPQLGSKKGIIGEFDFKIIYLQKGKVISLGTDGTKIRNLLYSKPSYQYEYFREFAEFLTNHCKDIENTAELWFHYCDNEGGIDDDFTLINILIE